MYVQRRSIREWNAEDRPREKMADKGIDALTDAELLATMLASGTAKLSAIDLARVLLAEFGSLRNLSRASLPELMAISGIGLAKASAIAASFELARRKLVADQQVFQFQSSSEIARYLIPKIGDLRHEVFYVVSLDKKHNVLGEAEVHSGGISSVMVDVRIVFKEAITKLASAIVVCHNHPSGSVNPSGSDDDLTNRLVQASKIMEIPIVDHLIVSRKNWYSYADQGRLKDMENGNYVPSKKSKGSQPQSVPPEDVKQNPSGNS